MMEESALGTGGGELKKRGNLEERRIDKGVKDG